MKKLKINHVWLDAAVATKDGKDTTLGVDFDNGYCVSLTLDPLIEEPLFSDILRGVCDAEPKTDSGRVYWINGASLTIDDIMKTLREEEKNL